MAERSRVTKRQWTSIALVAGGVLLVCIPAIVHARSLGWWQSLVYLGAGCALVGAWLFYRRLTTNEMELEERRRAMEEELTRVAEEEQRLEASRRTIQQELAQQASRLDQREHTLASRLTAYHEWLEFPSPVDLSSRLAEPPPSDSELAELVRKDRQLNELLQQETKLLFDHIFANRYAPDGAFQLSLVRDDLHALILKSARIYQPHVEQPLLETSLERVLRAASRASLQFLVVLDELPLSVKEYNLRSLYGYLRRAVQAYGAYKSVEPYWGYANTAYYLGRLALGVNPLSLGAWWFLGTLGREGAKVVATRVVNRQAMALLQNLVRVIGFEVASIYGGDFRHRDANWIYAAELTELLSEFPHSRDSIRHALKDLAALHLRSEYDRVFLTRLVANGASARPERYRAAALLTLDERRAIGQRLERFLESYVHGKTPDRVEKWQQEVESRLDVKLSIAGARPALDRETQVHDAVRSLAGFLNMVKQCESNQLHDLLERTKLWKELTPEQRTSFDREQRDAPAYLFEQPDLDPNGDIAPLYLDDLAWLAAVVPPHEASIDEMLRDVAVFLRQDPKKATALMEKHFGAVLEERLAESSPMRKVPLAVGRAVLDLVSEEKAAFLYGGVSVEPPIREQGSLWLLGTPSRLVLVAIEPRPRAIWRADGPIEVEVVKRLMSSEARVSGGIWLANEFAGRGIRVAAPRMGGAAAHFRPLLDWKPTATSDLAIKKSTDSF